MEIPSLRRLVVLWFAMQALLVVSTAGQAVSGNVNGTVADSSGAAITGAQISVRDLDRGTVFHVSSNAEGNFSQTHLLAGHYEVKVEHTGFTAYVAQAAVQVDATTHVDAILQPAGAQSTVAVSADSPLLMTDRAEVSTTLTNVEIEKLPVLDRNVTNLLLVIPGAQLNSWQHAASENPQQGIQANVNGQFFTARTASFSTGPKTRARFWASL